MKLKRTNTDIVRRRIRELRTARQLNQAQVSEAAGISVDALSRIENGGRSPSLHTLARIAPVFGVRVADLLSEEPPPAPKQSAAIRKMVSLLEREPEMLRRAAEKMIVVLVEACRK